MTQRGIAFECALVTTNVFIVLKLVNVISWRWVWVLSPMWMFAAFCVVCAIIKSLFEQ